MSIQTTSAEGVRGQVYYDDTPSALVAAICELKFQGRIFNPLKNSSASQELAATRQRWRETGRTVVLTSGVFDLFHQNHAAHLEYARMSAVPIHFDRHDADREGVQWQGLAHDQRLEYLLHALSSGAIEQVVSIDGNDHVADRKGGVPKQGGNSPRPHLDWETRARDVLLASSDLDGNGPQYLARAVTIHDKIHPSFVGTPHQSIMDIGQYVDPDVWAIGRESLDIIDALETDMTGAYDGIVPVVLAHRGPYIDKIIGDLSTTAISKSILRA